MKAVAYLQSLPAEHADALLDIELPEPVAGPRDLLVEVRAISVNPVDTKVRRNTQPEAGQPKVLGWDVAGVVVAVGSETSLFQVGDEVFYAGSIARAGGNSERHLVDERVVGRKPQSIGFAEAAALPLTAITAWELLFERLQLAEGQGADQQLLIVGAAGGVGSIMLQLARQLTNVTLIATASRPETQAWVREMGAHHVIDHSKPLHEELQRAGFASVSHVASLTQTDRHFDQLVEALAPQGRLALIDDPEQPLDVMKLKRKSLSLHWELMFTRSLFETPDMIEQHRLLQRVSELVDQGVLRSTLGEHFGVINAANLRCAHALLESGKAKGKIVLEGFRALT